MIEKRTIELVDKNTLQADVGDKSQLQTIDKTNIVAAINEVKDDINNIDLSSCAKTVDVGDKSQLETDDKTNIVTAINEVKGAADQAKQLGDNVRTQLVDKLISEGLNVSTNDSFTDLINSIVIGRKLPDWVGKYLWLDGARPVNQINGFSTCSDDKYAYTVGGNPVGVSGDNNKISTYDPELNVWTIITGTATGSRSFRVKIIANKLYALGGGSGSSTQCVDLSTGTSTSYPGITVPTNGRPLEGFGCAVVNTNIHCIGGVDGGEFNTHLIFDTLTNSWTKLATIPKAGYAISAEYYNGKIYCLGMKGFNISQYNLVYDVENASWEYKTNPPRTGYYFSTALVDDKIYVLNNRDFMRYNITTDSWDQLENLPFDASNDTGAYVGKAFCYFTSTDMRLCYI